MQARDVTPVQQRLLPGLDLAGMNAEPARQLGDRAFLTHRRQRHLCLELRTVLLSYACHVSPSAERPFREETFNLSSFPGPPQTLEDSRMRSILAIRAFALVVVVSCVTFLAPAAFAWDTPRFDPIPCPDLPPQLASARCGYLVVPEDRSQPSDRTIKNFVAIIPAQSARPAPDPVVYMGSGPGGIAIFEVAGLVDGGVNRNQDLVVMNQRGQFLSIPALTCAPIDDFDRRLLSLRFYSESTKRIHLRATAECHRELIATGADLPSYNSSENAADFADLRTVLKFPEWNVLGVSYGTDLAQMYVRDHPEGIRSIVLDSVIPITITIAEYWQSTRAGFNDLFRACAAEAACNAAHPHLETTVTDLVNMLEAEPLMTTMSDPATGEELKIVLDGGALIDWLRDQSRTNTALTRIPDLLDQLAQGRSQALAAIAMYRIQLAPPSKPGTPSTSFGLAYGVTCRENFSTHEDIIEAGRQAFPLYPASVQDQAVSTWAYTNDDCRRVWKVPVAPAEVRQPLVSSIPTLLISGSFDAVASLDFTTSVAASLSKATIISIPGIGHFVLPLSPCAQMVTASFLTDPSNPETSCVGTLKPPPFTPFQPEGVGPTVPAIQ
jgi:pimeloyl-ACP methyl ester carboxylesterase